MCGIVGLFLKNPGLKPQLGTHLRAMLAEMAVRGPDSAGFVVYREDGDEDTIKFTLFHPDADYDWDDLTEELNGDSTIIRRASHGLLRLSGTADHVLDWLHGHRPEVHVIGFGHSAEIYKEKGWPIDVADLFGLGGLDGTHGIGHTRMATESAVSTEHSHPFIAGSDICLVHNGSLSNHNRLRSWLQRHGMEFRTDNDSEVAARYVAYRLDEGATLKEALEAGLRDLDGFFTFCVGTRDGFAVVRDGIACKPAVMAETEDWVAMASEYRSLARLPGVAQATIWEPEPAVVYAWSLETAA